MAEYRITPIDRLNQVEQVQPVRRRDAGSQFGSMLQREIASASQERESFSVAFSKHARARAEERGIRLTLKEADIEHGRVIGNPLHLQQILMNIIDNAIKYNHPQGSVFVTAKETAGKGGDAEYEFVVEDTGIGIGEDFKKHIFEPFTQEHKSARTHYNGVGLGMSIVKQLVDQMKGHIAVESGACFGLPCPCRQTGRGIRSLRRRSRTGWIPLPGCAFFWWKIMR